jgi:malate dehydrogenase (quinone)
VGSTTPDVDVALVGGGIMSATLGMLLKQMRPDWSIVVYERLSEVAAESSDPWNNAGTGHAALCELNYTPERKDGSINIRKALLVNAQFHESRQFWAHLVERRILPDPAGFIHHIPQLSYVSGCEDVAFLRKRYDALARQPLFESLQISEKWDQIEEWAPLMMDGRDRDAPIAMTRSEEGTDVNFGALTRFLFSALEREGVEVRTSHDVEDLDRLSNGRWTVTVKERTSGRRSTASSRFVFIGAGGRAIHLLQRAGIHEAKGYGGFPVSGQFLRCTNPELIARHSAKVYGKPQVNAPPMSMPHLDTRMIDGKRGLLFGPYAGFTPKFLKQGSWLDLFRSIKPDNIPTMLTVAKDERALTMYLIQQVLQKHLARIETLRDFVPLAEAEDWELIHAGQRVQTMKRLSHKRGAIVFGTEVVSARDGSIAGLLGASPGASTTVSIMLNVIKHCFPAEYAAWRPRLREMIPSHDIALHETPQLLDEIRAHTAKVLSLRG